VLVRRRDAILTRPGRPYDAVVARTEPRRGVTVLLACAGLVTAGGAGPGPPGPIPHSAPAPAARAAAAAGYARIARAGNRRLEIDFTSLAGRDRAHLAAARADLRDAAATERLFDRRLLALRLPAGAGRIARLLDQINQARADLTAAAARSASLRQLRAFEQRLTAANQPVEQAVRVIRDLLGLPPPQGS
jgi:hypothetical protein